MSIANRVSRRLAQRRRFGTSASWLWTLYSSAALGRALPGKGSVRKVYLAGNPRPFFIRLGTTDFSVLQEIFIDGEYAELAHLQAASPVRTIVDLGANVGFSVRLWQTLFPAAQVVAVEPDADNMNVCRMNALATGEEGAGAPPGTPQPVLIQACAAGHARLVDLDRQAGAWGYSMKEHAPDASAPPANIEALTIDQILQRAGMRLPAEGGTIDLLKCDIEGAEEELFGEAARIEGPCWLDAVRTMVVELHGKYTPERFLADICGRPARRDYKSTTVVKSPTNWVVTAQRLAP
jgi:FkbM family methyltransferase